MDLSHYLKGDRVRGEPFFGSPLVAGAHHIMQQTGEKPSLPGDDSIASIRRDESDEHREHTRLPTRSNYLLGIAGECRTPTIAIVFTEAERSASIAPGLQQAHQRMGRDVPYRHHTTARRAENPARSSRSDRIGPRNLSELSPIFPSTFETAQLLPVRGNFRKSA